MAHPHQRIVRVLEAQPPAGDPLRRPPPLLQPLGDRRRRVADGLGGLRAPRPLPGVPVGAPGPVAVPAAAARDTLDAARPADRPWGDRREALPALEILRRRSRTEGKNEPRRSSGVLSATSPAVVDTSRGRCPLRRLVRPSVRSWGAAPTASVASASSASTRAWSTSSAALRTTSESPPARPASRRSDRSDSVRVTAVVSFVVPGRNTLWVTRWPTPRVDLGRVTPRRGTRTLAGARATSAASPQARRCTAWWSAWASGGTAWRRITTRRRAAGLQARDEGHDVAHVGRDVGRRHDVALDVRRRRRPVGSDRPRVGDARLGGSPPASRVNDLSGHHS